MEVDPDALRAWSKWLDGLSGDFKGLADGVNSAATGDPFPGTDLGTSVTGVRDQVKSALAMFSSRPAEMAEIAKGAGDKYEIHDTDFANQLRSMGGPQ
ncbi:hypothetical protein [Nocardia wallacei]|uniref:hypothetical protein n=1 Tax=Nocardia wallacei TaxID=480035 RepID=UPI001656A4B3|nr:hypothetical protein [Nocardia wallacei]